MSWLPSWVTGVDADETQKTMDETDAKLAALNQEKYQSGKWDQSTYDQAQANLQKSKIVDVGGEIDDAFAEGFNDGISNVRGTLGSILAFPFKLIPPIGWLLILVALLVYMGGWAKLAGILKKK
jgi:hypothetical protein